MKLRNVQKTGNMFYLYLPSKWCREKGITIDSRLDVDEDSTGNLIVSPVRAKDSGVDLSFEIDENDINVLSMLTMACFLNPVRSFRIKTKKKLDKEQLFHEKRLINSTLIEMEKDGIYSEPIISIGSPLSLLFIMLHKLKSMVNIMLEGAGPEITERYEDEIDSANMMVNKAVIASFMHKRESKRKLVELHYISLISTHVERCTDHLVSIVKLDDTEKYFLRSVYQILEVFTSIVSKAKDEDESFGPEAIFEYVKMVKGLKVEKENRRGTLIKTQLRHCSEILMDWTVTNKVED